MLCHQPVKDPLGGMALLARSLAIVFQNLVDDRQEWADFRFGSWLSLLIAGRIDMLQDPGERVPVNRVLLTGRSLAEFLVQHAAADFRPHLHIRVHSFPRSVRGLPDGKSHHWTTTHRELKQERHVVF